VSLVFSNLCSSMNTDSLQAVQREMAPVIAGHTSATYTFPGLFNKIDTVSKMGGDGLTPEQVRLTERLHIDFSRNGAKFGNSEQKAYAKVMAQLAALETTFQQNVMADESSFTIALKKQDLVGCPADLVAAAKQAAVAAGQGGPDAYVITLSRSLVEPFLTFSSRRDLREAAWRAWTRRGELDAGRDNAAIATRILKLRKKQAEFHGCSNFAKYQCADMMAKTPGAVMALLEQVWQKAKVCADRERQSLEAYVRSERKLPAGAAVDIQPWDWRYYAEKVRQHQYDFDEARLKPFLSLERVTEAVMSVSHKLFGLRYVKRNDIASYHDDVDTYEVRETVAGVDRLVAVFLHDNFARQFKSSGAWMSEYRGQTRNLPQGADPIEMVPIVSNNNNFAKAAPGAPTLLSFDDAVTLFHEMGHAHHGMLSDASYARLAGTNVLTDFVELPSQLMEHWLKQPEVLKEFARHYESGAVVPDALLEKRKAASEFNVGFDTVEYTVCALMDMALHQIEDFDSFDLAAFEKKELARLGMPQGIVMRHRPTHFQHLFSGSHYAAGYYVYLWAEVLDADAFAAFQETGNLFDPATAKRARECIYSAGNTVEPGALFRRFRGRDPEIRFMLEKKGLV